MLVQLYIFIQINTKAKATMSVADKTKGCPEIIDFKKEITQQKVLQGCTTNAAGTTTFFADIPLHNITTYNDSNIVPLADSRCRHSAICYVLGMSMSMVAAQAVAVHLPHLPQPSMVMKMQQWGTAKVGVADGVGGGVGKGAGLAAA